MSDLTHRQFRALGFAFVLPIVPPGAPISPRSTLSKDPGKAGKVPGVRNRDGLWHSFDWINAPSAHDVTLGWWTEIGAGVGLRLGLQPDGDTLVAADADTMDAVKAALIGDAVRAGISAAVPTRVGAAPRALYLFRVSGPFPYARLDFRTGEDEERLEILSGGKQCVVQGVHPRTRQPYKWTTELVAYADLPRVAPETLLALLESLRGPLDAKPIKTEGAKDAPRQENLRGPIEHVRSAIRALGNRDSRFPTRESFLDIGYSLKAALPDDPDEALTLFQDWAQRWDGGTNDPEYVEGEWQRMKPPFRRGARWLFEQAEEHGDGSFSRGQLYFEPPKPGPLFGVDCEGTAEDHTPGEDPYPLIWHGDGDDEPLASWLVDEMLFEVGTALLSGQWGTYKTFCALDLSAAVMVGGTFAGRQVKRRGGVLWLAVEGQGEVRKRLAAVAQEKVRPAIDGTTVRLDPSRLPFVWVKACPKLSAPNALAEFGVLIAKAAAAMKERFGLDLALVIIDTLSPAAELKDADDTAENQHVMSVLKRTAQRFGTLVCAVDHMGKDTSTGTRNSSVKEADVDSVVALIGERDLAGNVAKPRVAMRKNRGAPTGWQAPFRTRVVSVTLRDEVVTTLVIDWGSATEPQTATPAAPAKSPWTGNARILRDALERAMDTAGRLVELAANGPEVRAVDSEKVRLEFYATYPAESQDTKRQAFNRLLKDAVGKGLVASREIGGVDFLSLRSDHPQPAADQAA